MSHQTSHYDTLILWGQVAREVSTSLNYKTSYLLNHFKEKIKVVVNKKITLKLKLESTTIMIK